MAAEATITHSGGLEVGREVAGSDERERDDPHRLLGVVRPVCEGDEAAGDELKAGRCG